MHLFRCVSWPALIFVMCLQIFFVAAFSDRMINGRIRVNRSGLQVYGRSCVVDLWRGAVLASN